MSDAETFQQYLAQLERAPHVPSWLAQVAAALFDGQDLPAAQEWARRVQLERLDAEVPFSVVHDWHARTDAPAAELHARALAGETVQETEWLEALEPALREVYRKAYRYAEAYATASATARAYAAANDFSEDEAAKFADHYAELNTSANALAFAEANARAGARALAAAFAAADSGAYGVTYPFSYVQARVLGEPGAGGRLADGLAGSLERLTKR